VKKLSFILPLLLIGCASVARGPNQQVHINAYEAKTSNTLPADCILSNDEGIFYTKSNKSVIVGRDKDPLTTDCYTDTLAGQSIVNGRINGGFLAVDLFVIDLCIFSCWIDGLSGSWAEYPLMIDIPLDLKDDTHYKRLEEKASELKQRIEKYSKSLSILNEQVSPQKYSDTKQKIENAQEALKLINLELSLRKIPAAQQ